MNEKEEITQAKAIFSGKELLIERPEGMAFEEYRILKRIQEKVLKKLLANRPNMFNRQTRIKSRKKNG